MEKIRVLCATAKNEIGKNIIDDFLKLLLEINVKIEKQERKYLEDYNYEIIEEYEQDSLNLISINGEFQYRSNKCKFDIQRMTKDNQFLLDIQIVYLEIDDIRDLKNSQWFDFKEILLNKISEKYEYIYWLEDTQNQKMATELYLNMYELENYLREIVNFYMCSMHGGNWFEKYSYEDYLNKYKKFSEWFRNSKYNLFKKIDNHLFNLEIDDIFEALKSAKKIPLKKSTKKALETIEEKEKEKATNIANIKLLGQLSLWDEEKMGEAFKESTVLRWQKDLSKRRNMIAHNKMICREMYFDTLDSIEFFKNEFNKAEIILNNRIVTNEKNYIKNIQRDQEIQLNLEYCGIDSNFLNEENIIDRINDTDDVIELSGEMEDKIKTIELLLDDEILELEELIEYLQIDNFFDRYKFVAKELLNQYIEFCKAHQLYSVWIGLLNHMTCNVYLLIEPEIQKYLENKKSKMEQMRKSINLVVFDTLEEGNLLTLVDMRGNKYELNLSGMFCPDRGASNTLSILLKENEEIISSGMIEITYGDYDITEDGIPIPYVEDELIVDLTEVKKYMIKILDKIIMELRENEQEILNIEI